MRSNWPNLAGRRVLVVEYDRGVAESIEALMRSAGCETRRCEDGMTAVALATSWQPDLLLTDFLPRDMRWQDCVREIRALNRACAAIVLSTTCPDALIADAHEMGLQVLPKPTPAEELLETCSQLLAGRMGAGREGAA